MFLRIHSWRLSSWCWCRVFTLWFAFAATGPTFAQGREAKAQLEAVFKDWQFRQTIFKSARYVLDGVTEYKDKNLPPGNPIRPYRVNLLLDFVKKRYRMESSQGIFYANGADDPKKWDYRNLISTSAYDGEGLQSLTHRKANRLEKNRPDDLLIGKGNLGIGAQMATEVWPIFLAHGIVPTVHSPLFVDKLPFTHDPDDFEVAGRQLLNGQNCLVVRTEPFAMSGSLWDEIWVNPSQKSAIPRFVYFTDEGPWNRLDISWKNTAHGWWIDRWSNTWTPDGVRRITRFRVESFEGNPDIADSDFKLPVEPGMIVKVSEGPPPGKGLNPFIAASRMYKISPSGSWDEISATGFTTLEGKELPPEGRWRWIGWTLGAGLTLAALFLYVVRRYKTRAAL